MKLYKLIFLISIPLWVSACKDEPESPLKGCCDNPAINEAVGNGHIYVPNIFTPNGDGINDILTISTDSIDLIINVEVRNKEGITVFESSTVQINNPSTCWNGKVNGVVIEGLYTISVSVLAADGTNHTVTGTACNFPCDGSNHAGTVSFENCQFPAQVTDGQFDLTLPNFEPEHCLE